MSATADSVTPITFYRPNYHMKTPAMRSPEYVQMSTAAAITLALVPGQMHRRLAGDLKAPLERLHATLMRDEVVGAEVLGRTGGSIPVGGIRVPLVHDSILFVGDAAGLTHPITGAGIASAVVSGERAGLAAAEFLARGAALDEYAADMQDEFAESLARAVARREWLMERWHTPAAHLDETHKRGWIAFREYFVR